MREKNKSHSINFKGRANNLGHTFITENTTIERDHKEYENHFL